MKSREPSSTSNNFKPYILSDGCVVQRFKMLTYCRVRSAFTALHALPSNKIYDLRFFKISYLYCIHHTRKLVKA